MKLIQITFEEAMTYLKKGKVIKTNINGQYFREAEPLWVVINWINDNDCNELGFNDEKQALKFAKSTYQGCNFDLKYYEDYKYGGVKSITYYKWYEKAHYIEDYYEN